MGLLAYILTLPGNNDACGASTAWDIYLLPPSSLIFIPPPYLSLLPSFVSYSLYFFLTLFLFSMYVCIYLHYLSHPHHRFYMYILIIFVCIPSLYPFYLSLSLVYPILLLLLLIFLCLYVYFYFLPYFYFFGPIWGTFVIITNIWKNF